jgi:hypothetical protein
MALTNKTIGSDDFDSEIDDFLYGVGVGIPFGSMLNLKLGLAFHDIQMDVKEGSSSLNSKEYNGNDSGLYAVWVGV